MQPMSDLGSVKVSWFHSESEYSNRHVVLLLFAFQLIFHTRSGSVRDLELLKKTKSRCCHHKMSFIRVKLQTYINVFAAALY